MSSETRGELHTVDCSHTLQLPCRRRQSPGRQEAALPERAEQAAPQAAPRGRAGGGAGGGQGGQGGPAHAGQPHLGVQLRVGLGGAAQGQAGVERGGQGAAEEGAALPGLRRLHRQRLRPGVGAAGADPQRVAPAAAAAPLPPALPPPAAAR